MRITDVAPILEVTKDAGVASVNEPGGPVTFTVTVHNTSVEPVTSPRSTTGSARVPTRPCAPASSATTLAAGATTSCTFTRTVSGNADASVTDTVTVHAHDDENNDAMGGDTATVRVNDVAADAERHQVGRRRRRSTSPAAR